MFGLGLARGLPWVILAVGYGTWGFCWTIVGDISPTYILDCYQDIIGDALVAVAFVRNAIPTALTLAIMPRIAGMGPYDFFVTMGVISVICLLTMIPMIWFGKRCRRRTREKYRGFARVQVNARTFFNHL